MTIKRAHACRIALVCTSSLLLPNAAWGQNTPRVTLDTWVQDQFETVVGTCLTGFSKRKNRSIVPQSMRSWGVYAVNKNTPAVVHPSGTVDGLFSQVYIRENGTFKPYKTPIGSTWSAAQQPILYQEASNARQEHNCTTTLSGSVSAEAGLDFAKLNIAMTAAAEKSNAETAFIYGGKMISPVIAGLRRTTFALNDINSVSPFSVALATWQWYRLNPDAIENVNANKLEVFEAVDGMAFYRVSGLTQKVLLEGSGSSNFSIPFFSYSAEGSASSNSSTVGEAQSYSVAYWSPQTQLLPKPSHVASIAKAYAGQNFRRVADNKEFIETANQFDYKIDLAAMPSALCDSDFWTMPTTQAGGTAASIENLRVFAPDPAKQICRFEVSVTPSQTVASTMSIPLNFQSSLFSGNGDASQQYLTISPGIIKLPDYRSTVALKVAKSSVYSISDLSDLAQISVNFPVFEKRSDRRVTGVIPNSETLLVSCGSSDPVPVNIGSDGIGTSRTSNGASVSLEFTLPQSLVSDLTAEDPKKLCTLNGKLSLKINDQSGSMETDIPSYSFGINLMPNT